MSSRPWIDELAAKVTREETVAANGNGVYAEGVPSPVTGWGGQRLLDVVPEHVEWLWPGRLALGKMSVLDGDPGLGKSTVSLDIAARVSTGAPFPLQSTRRAPSGVVILSAEDGVADTIVPRMRVAGADLGRVAVMTHWLGLGAEEIDVTIPAAIPAIEMAIRDVGATLLIIDPLMAYFGSTVSASMDQDVRAALKPLALMLERTRCAVLMLRHLNKGEGKSAIYRGGGSIGIIGAARFGSLVTKNPDNPEERVIATTKCNLGPEPYSLTYTLQGVPGEDVARVVWADEPARWDANDLMAAQNKGSDEDDEADDVAAFTRDYLLEHGPSRFEDLWKEARSIFGWGDQKTRKGYKALGIRPRKTSDKDGQWLLWLPEQVSKGKGDGADLP